MTKADHSPFTSKEYHGAENKLYSIEALDIIQKK